MLVDWWRKDDLVGGSRVGRSCTTHRKHKAYGEKSVQSRLVLFYFGHTSTSSQLEVFPRRRAFNSPPSPPFTAKSRPPQATVSEATHVPCFPFAKGFLRCRRVLQLSPERRGSAGGIGGAVDTGWEEWGLVVSVRYSNPHQGPVLLQNTGSTTSFSRGVKNARPMSISNTESGFGR